MLQAPRWCAQAIPTAKGWQDPITNELFVARRFTEEQINEFFNEVNKAVDDMYGVTEEVQYEAPQMLHEAPVGHKSLEDMTKAQLVALAEERGIKVSKASNKRTLLEKLS